MTPTQTLLAGALLLSLAAPARAGDTRYLLSAGLLINQGNTVDLTQKTTGGFTVEAGALFSPEGFGPKLAVYAGYAQIPAAAGTDERPTFALSGPRVGVDLVYQPWDAVPLTLETGPSIHVWKGDQKGGDPGPYPSDNHLKVGWRLGAGYAFGPNVALSLRYTFTEWRSNADADLGPTNPSRPAYFSVTATYRF